MTEDKNNVKNKPGVHIKIGGNIGPSSAVGVDNTVTAQNVAGESIIVGSGGLEHATREDLLKFIEKLRTQVEELQDQFDPDDVTDIQTGLDKVAEMSAREKPPANRIKQYLESVRDIIKDTAATGAAVTSLVPVAEQVWEIVHHLFGV